MKCKIKILEVFALKSENEKNKILAINLLEGVLFPEMKFINTETGSEFIVTGIGMENKEFDSSNMSILIENLNIEDGIDIVNMEFEGEEIE